MAEQVKELKKKTTSKLMFHRYNQVFYSVKKAFFAALLTKCLTDSSSEVVVGIFVIGFVISYFVEILDRPIKSYKACRIEEFQNTNEEILVAANNAGLTLIGVEGNILSYKPRQRWWSSCASVQVLDQGNICKVIAYDSVIECLREYVSVKDQRYINAECQA